MSKENADTVRDFWRAYDAGDPTEMGDLGWIDANVVYEDSALPDHAGERYLGHDGIRRAWTRFIEPWESFKIELEWVREDGAQVVSCHRFRGRGKASTIEVEARYAYVWTFSEGKVIHYESFADPTEALKSAGLSE